MRSHPEEFPESDSTRRLADNFRDSFRCHDASGPTYLLDPDMLALSSVRDRWIGQYEAVLNQAVLSLDEVIRTWISATVLAATVLQRAAAVGRRKPPSSQATAVVSRIFRDGLGGP